MNTYIFRFNHLRKHCAFSVVILLLLTLNQSLQGAILRVKSDATGAGDGSTWSDAFPLLQDALSGAQPGDSVWVAAGVYYPDEGTGQTDNDRASSFVLNQDINLYGGFNGTENTLFARNPAANITVLSGDLEQNDGSKDADGMITDPDQLTGSNSHHVITLFSGSADFLIDGFSITGGLQELGGAPDIRSGGGIYGLLFGSLNLSACRIQGNFSTFGGGLFAAGSNLSVTLCSFQANRGINGGAYYGNSGSAKAFRSCVFAGNAATFGGAAYIRVASENQFFNCTFHGNSGAASGSAIYDLGSASELINCVAWNARSTGDVLDEIDNNGTDSLSFSHTLVQHVDLSASGGNFDGTDPANEPRFLVTLASNQSPQIWSDFRQASNSPIIDGGDNSENFLIIDILHRERVFNDTIDLGAVEFQPRVWHVDADAPGLNNGTSWSHAFVDLQDALAASINGDEIWVAEGVYRPGDGSDRNATFLINKTIRLYGGFAGTESNRDDRAPAANITVLSGDLDQNDVTGPTGIVNDPMDLTGNNAFQVCRVSVPADRGYNTEPVLLTGLNFTGGLGGTSGGGLYVGGSPGDIDVIGCRIRGNSSASGGGLLANRQGETTLRLSSVGLRNNHATSNGGGLNASSVASNPEDANILLSNVTFIENTSHGDGGAIRHTNALLLNNCSFMNNAATNSGGALAQNFGARVRIVDSTFTSNTAGEGGGLQLRDDSELIGSTFNGNTSSKGGAIIAEDGLVVTDSRFTGNEASGVSGGLSGGAIDAGSVVLTESTFASNVAIRGGAIRLTSDNSRIENCTFLGNAAEAVGGAIEFSFATAEFVNCVFGGNATGAGGSGGAIYLVNSTGSLVNCSFQGNWANLGGAINVAASGQANLANTVVWGNDANTSTSESIYVAPAGGATYTNSLVEFLLPAGSGNLDGTDPANNPNFLTPTLPANAPATGGDLRLQSGSPAIDQGLNALNHTTLDLGGLLRIAGAAIDLGAFEFGSTPPVTFASLYPALSPEDDENLNGISNYLEYAAGTDPTGPFDPSGQTRLNQDILILPTRTGATDVFATWEKSTDLLSGLWDEMIEGIDYTISAIHTNANQTITELLLFRVEPTLSYRQSLEASP